MTPFGQWVSRLQCKACARQVFCASFGLAVQLSARVLRGYGALRLLQVLGASVPSRLLSEALAAVTLEELERAARSARGHALRLTDLAPGVSLPALLARWEGEVRQTRLPCFPRRRTRTAFGGLLILFCCPCSCCASAV